VILQSFRNIFAIPDLRKRVLFTFGLLAVYRIGCIIPSPGVDPRALLDFMQTAQGGFFGFVNAFTGGSLERIAVFAVLLPDASLLHVLGVAPRERFSDYEGTFRQVVASIQLME